ncbi:MAG: bifunctional adenosylcobinamide kinase/adenosylcobinamide-phosphate guanylyltransferase [Treponema sp.]|nr:bifunctional adenosylcobinamide kinase/adenosylcobinamide-phosphate guanylyltransferase [Treponema sp.]
MKIFISGGCKNGKSYLAQKLAKAARAGPLYYIATMLPADAEDDQRIARHRREREGWGFNTIEQQRDIEQILRKCDTSGSFLLDSLTALLANEMFLPDGINAYAAEKICAGLREITAAIKNIVIVSDYIYSDAFPYDPLTENYRRSLAQTDRAAAQYCDTVLEAAYGNVIVHKGNYEKIP